MKKHLIIIFSFLFLVFTPLLSFASVYSSSGYVSYSNPVSRYLEFSDPGIGYQPDGALVASSVQSSDFVGYVATYDSNGSGDWSFDTYTDCSAFSECDRIFLNTATSASVTGAWPLTIRIFVFPFDTDLTSPASACFTGTYSSCLSDLSHTQVIDISPGNGSTECSSFVAGNNDYNCVLTDSSVLDQSAQQNNVGGDSFTPFMFAGALFLFFAIIAFIIKWLRSKV